MWIEFEYKNNNYRVRLEHKQIKRFLRQTKDKYYIHIQKDEDWTTATVYSDYLFEFNKDDNIFKKIVSDNQFNKRLYFDHKLEWVLELSDKNFEKTLINTTKQIIETISTEQNRENNIKNRITEI